MADQITVRLHNYPGHRVLDPIQCGTTNLGATERCPIRDTLNIVLLESTQNLASQFFEADFKGPIRDAPPGTGQTTKLGRSVLGIDLHKPLIFARFPTCSRLRIWPSDCCWALRFFETLPRALLRPLCRGNVLGPFNELDSE